MNSAYLKLLRDGDDPAWRQVHEKFHRLVVWIIRQRGVPTRDIEDVAADIWLKTVARISSFVADDLKPEAIAKVFQAWIAAITVNTTKDYFRKRREVLGDGVFFDNSLSANEYDPLEWYLPSSLTEQEVTVLQLRKEGYTFEEIANQIDVSLTKAYQLYLKAQQKINAAMMHA